MIERIVWVAVGGGVGSALRYAVSGLALRLLGAGFAWGTLAVNVIGSFSLSLIVVVALASAELSPSLRLALTTGLLGGFTTYSTFSYETLVYLEQGDLRLAGANVAANVGGGLAAAALGLVAGRWWIGG